MTSQEEGAQTNATKLDVSALCPEVHALRPVVVKLKPLIKKDTDRSSEPDGE